MTYGLALAVVGVALHSCTASATIVSATGKLMRGEDAQHHQDHSAPKFRQNNVRHAAMTDPVLRPIPPDPYAGKVKAGYCANFLEGSMLRLPGEQSSRWATSDHLTEEQCYNNCDQEFACEQAVYKPVTEECWIGTNAMTQEPNSTRSDYKCYAKRGFNYTLTFNVKDGWCNGFVEGWGGAAPTQCDLSAVMPAKNTCSHWGAEYGLSERGCWAMCQENPTCTQAVYENKQDAWGCFIGTSPITLDPVQSRCTDCNNRCYARSGFSAAPTPAPTPAPPQSMSLR